MKRALNLRPTSRLPGLLAWGATSVFTLAACGDDAKSPAGSDTAGSDTAGSDTAGSDTAGSDTVTPPAGFPDTLTAFTAERVGQAAGEAICYDFDLPGAVDCETAVATWDIMFNADTTARAFNIWTNGGIRGAAEGQGAAFGPLPLAELAQFPSGSKIPGWFRDFVGGVFASSPWYAYDVLGTHDVTPNGRVYIVKTDTAKYKVQLLSYYGAGGASGKVQMRYGVLGEATSTIVELDASAGGFGAPPDAPANRAAYFDFDAGKVVEIDDTQAKTDTTWDLAIKRFDVMLNGGASGPGTVTGAIADKRDALYVDGVPQPGAFEAQTEATVLAAFEAVTEDTGLRYVADRGQPYLNGDGGPMSWFGYEMGGGGPPTFFPRENNWWVIRSSTGDSYMKLHFVVMDYSTYTFGIEGYIQKASAE